MPDHKAVPVQLDGAGHGVGNPGDADRAPLDGEVCVSVEHKRMETAIFARVAAAAVLEIDARSLLHREVVAARRVVVVPKEVELRANAQRNRLRGVAVAERMRGRAEGERRPGAGDFRSADVRLAGLRRGERVAAFDHEPDVS